MTTTSVEAKMPLGGHSNKDPDGYLSNDMMRTDTIIPVDPDASKTYIYPIHPDFPIRQYQLTITQTALFHNTLISLPTGLGKTLIAAVVMYNYYRWFCDSDRKCLDEHDKCDGKVLFCAPTRPLVHQQMEACYNIVQIPNDVIAEISGKVKPSNRKELWKTKSVFFGTAQAIVGDVISGICPVSNIVCVVFDEAHRAKGDYAYVQLMQRLHSAGAIFRVIGLSATPGNNIQNIQLVIDNLSISRIEVRLETDPDVTPYVHEKAVEIVRVANPTLVTCLESQLNNILHPLYHRLQVHNALASIKWSGSIESYSSYTILKARSAYIQASSGDRSLDGYFYALQTLLGWRNDLKVSGIGVVKVKIMRSLTNKQSGNFGVLGNVLRQPAFKSFYESLSNATCRNKNEISKRIISTEEWQQNNPKLQKLRLILVDHFQSLQDRHENQENSENLYQPAPCLSSRVIVFSQWRDSVEEIVEVLQQEKPLLRPTKFVGQSGSLSKRKRDHKNDENKTSNVTGMKQWEQQQVIESFKANVFNVIVCTCIGEEGLDIGEVDLIVNFDCLRSPIRMIQRTGRTGRKRNGRVVCLVAQGQEESRLQSSNVASKSLGQALKNIKAFKFCANKPIFPVLPILEKKELKPLQKYRLSQVGGHTPKRVPSNNSRKKIENLWKSHSEPNGGGISLASQRDKDSWKLTTKEEETRQELFGTFPFGIVDVKSKSFYSFPPSLRRKLANCLVERVFASPRSTLKTRVRGELLHPGKKDCGNRTKRFFKSIQQYTSAVKIDVSSISSFRSALGYNEKVATDDHHIDAQNNRIEVDHAKRTNNTRRDPMIHVNLDGVETNMEISNEWKTPKEEIGSFVNSRGDVKKLTKTTLHKTESDLIVHSNLNQELCMSCKNVGKTISKRVEVEIPSFEKNEFNGNSVVHGNQQVFSPEQSTDNQSSDVVNFKFVLQTPPDSSSSSSEELSPKKKKEKCAQSTSLDVALKHSLNETMVLSSGHEKKTPDLIIHKVQPNGNSDNIISPSRIYNGKNVRKNKRRVFFSPPTPDSFNSEVGLAVQRHQKNETSYSLNMQNKSENFDRFKHIEDGEKDGEKSGIPITAKSWAHTLNKHLKEKRNQKATYEKFFDTEAAVDTEDELDDSEEEVALRIEEEENASDNTFINDTSQLEISQDTLDAAENKIEGVLHRQLDCERDRFCDLSTPVFNRQMISNQQVQWESPSPPNSSASLKGLGKMHFIRSVIQHHREGGNAEEIEEEYNKLETFGTQNNMAETRDLHYSQNS